MRHLWLMLTTLVFIWISGRWGSVGGDTVLSPQLKIASADRVANQAPVTATLTFTTSATGSLPNPGNITLTYPSDFFASDVQPEIGFTSPSHSNGSSGKTTQNQIIITTTADIDQSTYVIVTIAGLTMGEATNGSSTGITVTTSSDSTASDGSPSGVIVSHAVVATKISPQVAYATSVITITGGNFINNFQCTAKVGSTPSAVNETTVCQYVNSTTIVAVIHSSTESSALPGTASSVEITFADSGICVTVPGTPLQVVTSPVISSFVPTTGQIFRLVTLLGANFISSSDGGNCASFVGGLSAISCYIVSGTELEIVLGSSVASNNASIQVIFNEGGAMAEAFKEGFIVSPTLYNCTANGPNSASTLIHIIGAGYGGSNVSPKIMVGDMNSESISTCENSRWISATTITCRSTNSKPSTQTNIQVTIQQSTSSITKAFSFNAIEIETNQTFEANPSSGSSSATVAGFSFGSAGYSGRARVGRGAASSADMTGGSACEASTWRSSSVVECKASAGMGGGSHGSPAAEGLPVVVTVGLQQGSRTQAWCYDAAVVSSAGGLTNGPSSGCTSATVAGFSFWSWGYSGKARVGRGAVSDMDMTGGTACEVSRWKSNSAVECKLRNWWWRRAQGRLRLWSCSMRRACSRAAVRPPDAFACSLTSAFRGVCGVSLARAGWSGVCVGLRVRG